jgi:glycosyltransferase involved in cell wall biosynthesis
MQNDLVSIITPLYNGSRHIAESIESLLNQTIPLWEMIVIDDCSTDQGRGREIVREYLAKDPRISLICLEKNSGSSGARNSGIKVVRGEYLAFLDADDLWDKRFLEKQLLFMKQLNASIVFSSYRRIAEDSNEEILAPFIVPRQVDYRAILKSNSIFTSTVMLHTKKLGKHYFNQQLESLRDDYVYWLTLLREYVDYAHGNPEILATYRMRRDSVTAKKSKMIIPHWKVLRKNERLSLVRSLYYISCWAWISFWKYMK